MQLYTMLCTLTKLALLTFIFTISAQAEFMYLARSPEGLLMGDAFTAVADDENTLFYNPAALGRHSGVTLTFLDPRIEVTDVLSKNIRKFKFEVDEQYKNWPKSPEGIANRVLGTPFYFNVGITPTIKMQNFAMSFFANSKTSMVLENAVHPNINLDYRLDRGFLMGYAFRIGPKNGSQFTSFGIGIKSVNRQGLQGRYDLFGTELIELTANSDSYKAIRSELGFAKGSSWGGDLGIEHVVGKKDSRFVIGASLLDVGNISFSKEEGSGDVPRQDMSLNFGTSYYSNFKIFDYTISADFKNAIDPASSFGSKIQIGARLGLPVLDVYLGWNGGYGSYGIGVDLFMFKLLAGFYGVETGYSYGQREGERALVMLKLLDMHFDL